MNPDDELRLYREQMGKEAAERQEDLAKRTCPTCHQVDSHHPTCLRGRRAAQKAQAASEQPTRRRRRR